MGAQRVINSRHLACSPALAWGASSAHNLGDGPTHTKAGRFQPQPHACSWSPTFHLAWRDDDALGWLPDWHAALPGVGVCKWLLLPAYLQTQTLADLCSTYAGGGFKSLSTQTSQSCSLQAQPTLHPVHARSYLCVFCTSS